MIKSKILTTALLFTLLFTSCAPQAKYFYVDIQANSSSYIPINADEYGIFPVTGSRSIDSLCVVNVALGMAQKIEKDNKLTSGTINIFAVPSSEFSGFTNNEESQQQQYNKSYATDLMLKTDQHKQIYLSDLKFSNVTESTTTYGYNSTELKNLLVPYSVKMSIYNSLTDSMLCNKTIQDSILLQVVCTKTDLNNLNTVAYRYLPDLSNKIGEVLASSLTPQWETQEKLLITYSGERVWEKAYQLAYDFKWKEAINIWMQLASSQNPKKASCAAYNIAVACQISEDYKLAKQWAEFGLEKYNFKELALLYQEVKGY